ncbi:MAG: nucleoside hydrolase [Rhodospirillales bacterium]|nr:nucleoside hydrolase [Rhodospirillales bacterium]
MFPALVSAVLAFWATASAAADAPRPVWIDADPSCSLTPDDPSDCWALAVALRSPEITIRGISVVFGTVQGERPLAATRDIVKRVAEQFPGTLQPPVYRGSYGYLHRWAGIGTEASQAITDALRDERLTVIALGPLTNLSTVLFRHPSVTKNIERIIAVIGASATATWPYPDPEGELHRDPNVRHDPNAVSMVLDSGVPLIFVPREAAIGAAMTSADLERVAASGPLGRELDDATRPWAAQWYAATGTRTLPLFDAVAVAYAVRPEAFACTEKRTGFDYSGFLGLNGPNRLDVGTEGRVGFTYCASVDPAIKTMLLDRIAPRP